MIFPPIIVACIVIITFSFLLGTILMFPLVAFALKEPSLKEQ